MIPVQDLHYAIKQSGNHTDAEYFTNLFATQIDYYLNKGIHWVVGNLVKDAEKEDSVTQDLIQLTIRDKKLSAKAKGNFYTATLPEDLLKPLAIRVIASKKGCSPREFIVRRFTSDKIFRALKNANIKRFWDFEETVAIQSAEGLKVYRQPDVTYEIFFDYIRKPKDVKCPSCDQERPYIEPNGDIVTEDQHFEIDSTYLWREIVARAQLDIRNDMGRIQDYQTQRDSLQLEN